MPMKNTPNTPIINLPSGPVPMRRLGIDDPFKLLRIVTAAAAVYSDDQSYRINPLPLAEAEGLKRFILLGLGSARETAIPWLGSLVNLTAEESTNPDIVPLPVWPELVAGVLSHPDLIEARKALEKITDAEVVKKLLDRMKVRADNEGR